MGLLFAPNSKLFIGASSRIFPCHEPLISRSHIAAAWRLQRRPQFVPSARWRRDGHRSIGGVRGEPVEDTHVLSSLATNLFAIVGSALLISVWRGWPLFFSSGGQV